MLKTLDMPKLVRKVESVHSVALAVARLVSRDPPLEGKRLSAAHLPRSTLQV